MCKNIFKKVLSVSIACMLVCMLIFKVKAEYESLNLAVKDEKITRFIVLQKNDGKYTSNFAFFLRDEFDQEIMYCAINFKTANDKVVNHSLNCKFLDALVSLLIICKNQGYKIVKMYAFESEIESFSKLMNFVGYIQEKSEWKLQMGKTRLLNILWFDTERKVIEYYVYF